MFSKIQPIKLWIKGYHTHMFWWEICGFHNCGFGVSDWLLSIEDCLRVAKATLFCGFNTMDPLSLYSFFILKYKALYDCKCFWENNLVNQFNSLSYVYSRSLRRELYYLDVLITLPFELSHIFKKLLSIISTFEGCRWVHEIFAKERTYISILYNSVTYRELISIYDIK